MDYQNSPKSVAELLGLLREEGVSPSDDHKYIDRFMSFKARYACQWA